MHATYGREELSAYFIAYSLAMDNSKTIPFHKKRRKGARRKLDRRKMCVQQKENISPPTHSTPTLPRHWIIHASSNQDTKYLKIDEGRSGGMCQVSSSVTLHQDGTWTVFFLGQIIAVNNSVLTKFPECITLTPTLQEIIFAVDRATLCPGNPEEKYVSVCKRRKDGEICGERGFGQTIGYIDVRDLHGNNIIV